ncbi:hypothetical protein FRC07_013623, partial [Ceratobasidium sp. 392]
RPTTPSSTSPSKRPTAGLSLSDLVERNLASEFEPILALLASQVSVAHALARAALDSTMGSLSRRS